MFPSRSDFSSTAAYSAWWYVQVGAGRRRVCSTDGGNFIGDLTDFFRQLTWEFGSPDGSHTLARDLRPAPSQTAPTPIMGTTRVPAVPAAVVTQLRAEAGAWLESINAFVHRQSAEVIGLYLEQLERIPGLQRPSAVYQFAAQERAANAGLARMINDEVQRMRAANVTQTVPDLVYTAADIRALETMDTIRLLPAWTSPNTVSRLGPRLIEVLQQDARLAEPAVSSAVTAVVRHTSALLQRVWDDAVEWVPGRFSSLLRQLPPNLVEQIHRDANTAQIIAEAEASSAQAGYRANELARAVAQVERPALSQAVQRAGLAASRLGWFSRMRGFFRGLGGGVALDAPRPGWAFSGAELASDVRWDAVFHSAVAAYLRVTLGGASVFSMDVAENERLTLRWWHDLPPAWRAVYSQLVEDYTRRTVSITSVYVAAWILSNVHSLDAGWRAFLTDPRQAVGFVGLEDVAVPTDAVLFRWDTSMRSACLTCPLTCNYDTSSTTQPTSILPPNSPASRQIRDTEIRISFVDPSLAITGPMTSAVAKADEGAPRYWIAGLVVIAGGAAAWALVARSRRGAQLKRPPSGARPARA